MDRIGREVRVYYDKVNELDGVFHKFYLALHNISFDEETLSNQIRYFKNQKGVRDKIIPEPGKLETMFEEFFEAVMWIIYLGDPYKWVDFDAWNKPKLAPIDEETIKKYTIERLTKETRLQQLPASFKVTLNNEFKILSPPRGLPGENIGPKYINWDPSPLNGLRIMSIVPREYLSYLVKRFSYHGQDETHYMHMKVLKQENMGKEGGFGIDGPEPFPTYPERVLIALPDADPGSPTTPLFDPTDLALTTLIDDFLRIYRELKEKNSDVVQILQRKFSGKVDLSFSLP
jgi:hypothetical protein